MIRSTGKYEKTKKEVEKTTFMPHINHMTTAEVNTTAARKHVGEIERYILLIKERSRALTSDLPYTKLPCQEVIHLVYFAVLWLNSLPATAGVSDKYSP